MSRCHLDSTKLLGPVGEFLEPVAFDTLPGLKSSGLLETWRVFRRSCLALAERAGPLRAALPLPEHWRPAFETTAHGAEPRTDRDALEYFRERFDAFEIGPEGAPAFFTGYYEPDVEGRLVKCDGFEEALLARPPDLVSFHTSAAPLGPGVSAGRYDRTGRLVAYSTRAEIENGAIDSLASPVVWVRDGIEAFMIHVQGSARIRLQDGSLARLTYAGRNGRPYTSIGAILIRDDQIASNAMSLNALKGWIRAHGQKQGEKGRLLMQRNESFIFFRINMKLGASDGPIGAQSVPLTPLRSIAVDRSLWPYGLPYWLAARLPWRSPRRTPFETMAIGQDTGSAIVGPSRADIFFGSGDQAGARAGDIRDRGAMFVLLPKLASPT